MSKNSVWACIKISSIVVEKKYIYKHTLLTLKQVIIQ